MSLHTRIDVHQHFVPQGYRDEVHTCVGDNPDGAGALPVWSVDAALQLMAEQGIVSSLLSISTPGVHFGDDQRAATLARHVNEAGARLVTDHPGRFGLFASLPVPAIDLALAEIRYAFDELHVDGVSLLTHTHGVYLGDAVLDPVFDELDRRGATVFIHPTSPACHQQTSFGYPRAMIEFIFDTTRAVSHLILSGTLQRCPNLKIIVPHCGGALPSVAARLAFVSRLIPASAARQIDTAAELRRLYYDVAGFVTEGTLGGLLDIVAPGQLLYGSDWPFTPTPLIGDLAGKLDALPQLDPAAKEAMWSGNARRLFPRLGRRSGPGL